MRDKLESVTRAERVDRQLAKAGWTRSSRRVVDEFFLSGDAAVRADGDPDHKDAFVDTALILPDGRPIAIVEVKCRFREALEGECQSADYADRCKRKYGIDPALKRPRAGELLDDDDLAAIGALLEGPDLFISEARLREAYGQPAASLADFLRHILGQIRLPSREAAISEAFDDWVARHPQLGATQLLFVRTLRHALIQHAEVSSLEVLRQPPFTNIGDSERLFAPDDLEEILELAMALAA